MKTNLTFRTLLGPTTAAVALLLPLLTGCSGFRSTAATPAVQTLNMTGAIHGGQQPVTGAKIYLFTAGTYKNSPSNSLLTGTGVATDSSGNGYVLTNGAGQFAITGDYTCPTGGGDIGTYLLAIGGNPGLTAGTNNSAIALMAPLGLCANLTASTFINVNEVTTVAAVTALQQFMTDATHLADGTNSSQPSYGNPPGIPNAMLTATNLASIATGQALAAPAGSGGVAPQARINTLANILAGCVNTAAPTSTQCAALFTAATPSGGTAPADTVAAMLQIAKNPGTNVATLYGLGAANAPFQPALTAAPNDLSLGITFTTGISYPAGIAIETPVTSSSSTAPPATAPPEPTPSRASPPQARSARARPSPPTSTNPPPSRSIATTASGSRRRPQALPPTRSPDSRTTEPPSSPASPSPSTASPAASRWWKTAPPQPSSPTPPTAA